MSADLLPADAATRLGDATHSLERLAVRVEWEQDGPEWEASALVLCSDDTTRRYAITRPTLLDALEDLVREIEG